MRGTDGADPPMEPGAGVAEGGPGGVPAPLPEHEEARLGELRRTGLLDSAADAAFDALTGAAATLFGVPTSLITLVDRDRQWFKSCYGFQTRETSRDIAFCGHAILSDEVMVIPDATRDPRFATNPQVTGEPHIRFYAGAPLKSASGNVLGTLCIIDTKPRADFSAAERELLRRLAAGAQSLIDAATDLKAADETRALFLSTVSHDLRGRVAAIMGYADLLQRHRDRLDPARRDSFVQQVRSSAQQLAVLLDDILDLERASLGELKPDIAAADVGALVRRVVANHGVATRRKTQLDVPEAVAPVDAKLLERAVENLVANAEKHTPASAAVTIRVSARDDGVEIAVEDEGDGVPEDERDAIFEAFRRGRDAASRPSGSGLGLYLVRRFVELQGGRAWVEDRAGGGASFRVWLSRAGSAARA